MKHCMTPSVNDITRAVNGVSREMPLTIQVCLILGIPYFGCGVQCWMDIIGYGWIPSSGHFDDRHIPLPRRISLTFSAKISEDIEDIILGSSAVVVDDCCCITALGWNLMRSHEYIQIVNIFDYIDMYGSMWLYTHVLCWMWSSIWSPTPSCVP